MTGIRLSGLLAASALAFASLAGCASEDTAQPVDDSGADQAVVDSGVDAAKDAGKDSTVADTGVDATNDGSVVDAADDAIVDASQDAAIDSGDAGDGGLAAEGTPCKPPNAVEDEACGLCGTHKRACLPDGDGGYAWGAWGFCQGQVVNGCDPNLSYPDSACGNCGTVKKVCLNNCTFDLSQQCTEPPNACKPGSTNFVLGLSCDGGGREQTCDNQCAFGNFGACQDGPTIPGVTASATAGQTVSAVFNMPSSPKLARTDFGVTCPMTYISASQTVYNYASIKNPLNNKSITVSIYHSQAVNGPDTDTIMAVYAGGVPPADNDLPARKNCVGYVSDSCSDSSGVPTSCVSEWAGLMSGDSNSITIGPDQTVVVYSAAWSTSSVGGDFQLNVRTDSVF